MKPKLPPIEVNPARRSFLKTGAAVASAVIAPGVFLMSPGQARSPDEPASASRRWGLLINTNLLSESDVEDCVTACQKEHGWKVPDNPDTDAQWIRKIRLTSNDTGNSKIIPMMCLHCDNPPCVDVCPTGASFKRADGIVLVNKHTCIGCRYCMMACPYKARSFIHENLKDQLPVAPRGKGTVESCTMCVHRIDKDGENAVPACAEAVNKAGRQAILFGDLNDPESDISRRLAELKTPGLRADLNTNPSVRYEGL